MKQIHSKQFPGCCPYVNNRLISLEVAKVTDRLGDVRAGQWRTYPPRYPPARVMPSMPRLVHAGFGESPGLAVCLSEAKDGGFDGGGK